MLSYAFKHKGDCVVLAGGKSVDYIPKEFYRGKFVIGVNQAGRRIEPDIIVRKEFVKDEGVPVYASLHSCGSVNHPCNPQGPNITLFDHNDNKGEGPIDTIGCHPSGEKVIVGGSTITSAIHLAAIMGFTTINLVGHDLCQVDGENNFDGYYDDVLAFYEKDGYARWLDSIAWQTRFVSNYVFDVYGAVVVTVSPFFGLKAEGHVSK